MTAMPAQRPGRSKQDYGTPWDFIRAVQRRFGNIDVDLAARRDNAKAPRWIGPARNSLRVCWSRIYLRSLGWLNPPFDNIEPWAAKCAVETGLRIIMLTPASVGTNWFADHVHGRAWVLALSPRLTFEGHEDPFPKDCMLSLFGFGKPRFDLWRWK